MAYEHKEGRGTLWPNQDKDRNNPDDKRPNVKGTAKYKGQIVNVSGWVGEIKGQKVLNIKIEEPGSGSGGGRGVDDGGLW